MTFDNPKLYNQSYYNDNRYELLLISAIDNQILVISIDSNYHYR